MEQSQEETKQSVSNNDTIEISKPEKEKIKKHYYWTYPLGGLLIGGILGVVLIAIVLKLLAGSDDLLGVVPVIIILFVCPGFGLSIGIIKYGIVKHKDNNSSNRQLSDSHSFYMVKIVSIAIISLFASILLSFYVLQRLFPGF